VNSFFIYDTPIGRVAIADNGEAITHIYFAHAETGTQGPREADERETDLTHTAIGQLREYFRSTRREFDLPLMPQGTPFQLDCWRTLRTIPYGQTCSYGEIARRIGRPRASRAVGMSNNRNPIAIVIPCHRVIGADGSLTGYAGGLNVKRRLLELEGALPPRGTHFHQYVHATGPVDIECRSTSAFLEPHTTRSPHE
jgi:methylated-DNA-[protein]-cysteine S-methyltransferase